MTYPRIPQYERIWEALKQAQADPSVWIKVEVGSVEMMQTIINMVQNIKSRNQVSRRALDLPAFGKLEIRREPEKKRLFFRLKNSGDAL
jgi:hypothetical protein